MTQPLWNACLKQLELELSAQEFNTWIRPLHLHHSEQSATQSWYLLAPNRFVLEWVKKHFFVRITNLLIELNHGKDLQLVLQVGSRPQTAVKTTYKPPERQGNLSFNFDTGNPPQQLIIAPKKQPSFPFSSAKSKPDVCLAPSRPKSNQRYESPLNPRYTFNNFIIGQSNQLAHAASQQASHQGGFNPLFLYGGVGLGKTHLMHAVGHALEQKQPDSRIVYLHSERFVSEMVKALQERRIDEFKHYYRSVDILLIDDIQFLLGKIRSQEEFFHTFNALMEGHQQVIITCDRTPGALNGLEERLRSRLASGLSIKVEIPSVDTRVEIINTKASQARLVLPDNVSHFVAENVSPNIRELEGALHRLIANARLMNQHIDLDFAKQILDDFIQTSHQKTWTVADIQQQVANYFNLSVQELLSKSRSRQIVRPRQIALTLAKELTQENLPSLGRAFGGKDRSTVLYSCRAVHQFQHKSPKDYQDYLNLMDVLQQSG